MSNNETPAGVELTEGERRSLCLTCSVLSDHEHDPEGDERCAWAESMIPAVNRILATRQAPTALDREAVAERFWDVADQGGPECEYWDEACPSCRERFLGHADAVLALPGVTQAPTVRTEAEVKAEALREALREAREEAKYIRHIYADNRPCKPLEVVDVLDVLLDQRAERIGGEG